MSTVDCDVFKTGFLIFPFNFVDFFDKIISKTWKWACHKPYTMDEFYFACYYPAVFIFLLVAKMLSESLCFLLGTQTALQLPCAISGLNKLII